MLNFSNHRILIIGDVMLDQYVKGKVDRISPEAPVPVLQKRDEENRLGGAANVALNLLTLGAKPTLIGVIGDDYEGVLLTKLLDKQGLKKNYLVTDAGRHTTLKIRMLANGQQLLRVDREDSHAINQMLEDDIFATVKNLINAQAVDAIVLQDYNKGVLTKRLIRGIIDFASLKDVPTLVDPKIENFFSYQGATIIKPNKREVELALKSELKLLDFTEGNKLINLRTALRCKCLFTTLSKNGVAYYTQDKMGVVPTKAHNIVDVSGAGDSVLAILACCVVSNIPWKMTAILSNIAGGQVCSRRGVVTIDKDQLEKELKNLKISI